MPLLSALWLVGEPGFKFVGRMIEEETEARVAQDRNDSLSPWREKSDWRPAMRSKIVSVLAAIIALAWSVHFAHAGAIRYAAKALHQGSITAVQKTSDAAGTATGDVENAGKAMGTALKDGTVALGKDAASAPGMAVQGTKGAATKLWKAVW